MRVVYVHGACATDGAWWWSRMVAPLAERGFSSSSVELPSCGVGSRADLHADAEAVRAVLDEDDAPKILCGHSYGGMVITDAASGREDVRRLIYITAAVPDHGETMAELTGPEPSPWLEAQPDGTVAPRASLDIGGIFLNGCDEATVREATQRLGPQSQAVFNQAPRGIAWRSVPSTYVLCTEDNATPPAKQREWANRTSTVAGIAAGHHPFLSHPDLLADLIAGLN